MAASPCPPLGAILPPPVGPLASDEGIQKAARNLSFTLTNVIASDKATSVAVQMTSLSDREPLFQFYRTAQEVNLTGAHSVTPQTQFRFASVTKVFTVLAMLQHEERFDWRTPVPHYIPELMSNQSSSTNVDEYVVWEQATLDAMVSQLGGIPRDIQDQALLYDFPFAEAGFPKLNASDLPPCGIGSNLKPCNMTEYIYTLKVRYAVYATYTTPVYSNAAYALLGLALERIMDKSYTSIIQSDVFDRLGMYNSSIDTPNQKHVLIPTGDSLWDLDDGFLRPAGQLYSSIADLSTFGLAILNSTLLKPSQTRRWLKPRSHTSSPTFSVGAPWEIFRPDALTLDSRVIDLYTKNGGIGQYGSYLILVPDYNVAVTVLAAGPNNQISEISEAVLRSMVPAVDAVARSQAAKKYGGFYKAAQGSSNITIVVTDAGLRVKQWFNNGKDILAAYASVFQPFKLDLYPSGLRGRSTSEPDDRPNGKVASSESWRGVYNYVKYPYNTFLDHQCSSWLGIDGNVYGQKAVDEFAFDVDREGNVVSLRNSAVRTLMNKQ